MNYKAHGFGLGVIATVTATIAILLATNLFSNPRIVYIGAWALLQWSPIHPTNLFTGGCNNSSNSQTDGVSWLWGERLGCYILDAILQEENQRSRTCKDEDSTNSTTGCMMEIPSVNVQNYNGETLLEHLQATFGTDWQKRPLLLKGLWSKEELRPGNKDSSTTTTSQRPRPLSIDTLSQMDLQIPYFTNATLKIITPDAIASVRDIVHNISVLGHPHKIGTQLIVEQDPTTFLSQVAPLDIVTMLFGNYFTPQQILGSGPWNLFPGTTTVPIFMASSGSGSSSSAGGTTTQNERARPFTTLHCEPIGNVAVQLSGQKKWTLILPEYSFRLKPGISPDGRAFFASWATLDQINSVPHYSVVTQAGDALWVPTWTWHEVDYIHTSIPSSEEEDKDKEEITTTSIAMGASLFHFRVFDFVENHGLFSFLIIPAMMKELLGANVHIVKRSLR